MTSDDQGDELRGARREIERLRAENEQLQGRLHELEAKLEAALRAGKRQSAPFSKRGAEG
jgi:BMFP domain-containing protein YqiC